MSSEPGSPTAPPPDGGDDDSRLHISAITEMPAGHDAELATIFREMRRAAGISTEQVAGRLATPVETIDALENGNLLALPESTLGLLPGNGGTQRLPRLIGAGPALELMLSGGTVSPQQALDLGMVNKLFPADSLADESKEYAMKLATGPTKALGHIKRCVHEGMQKPLRDGLALERTNFENERLRAQQEIQELVKLLLLGRKVSETSYWL